MSKQPKKKKPEPLSGRLRKAVDESDLSRYQIANLAGIDHGAMSRFMHGTGLNLESIDRLCDVLNLELVERKGG